MPVKSILVRVCFCNQGFPKLEALQVLFGSLVFGSLGCAHAMENQRTSKPSKPLTTKIKHIGRVYRIYQKVW